MMQLFKKIGSLLLIFGMCTNFAKNPRITIITSVYKGDEFIEGFLADITQQTIFDQCELIMINARSPGNEEAVIKKYMEKFPNIRYEHLAFDPGLYQVWNLAIQLGTGEFITNANLDDRLAHNCYEVHMAEFDKDPEVMLVYSDRYDTHRANETFDNHTGTKFTPSPQFNKQMMYQCWPSNNPMWRRTMHEQYGYFDTRYKCSGDWEMWLRAVEGGAKFKKIDGYYSLFYYNPAGLSTSDRFSTCKEKEDQAIRSRYSYLWARDSYEDYYGWARRFDKSNQGAHDTWPLALTCYLRAHALDPRRIEPLVRIAQHYCTFGDYSSAYFFAHNACQVPCPEDQPVEKELYDYTRYDLLGISSWYVQAYDEGEAAIKKALESKPDEQHLKNNLKVYVERRMRAKKKIVSLHTLHTYTLLT